MPLNFIFMRRISIIAVFATLLVAVVSCCPCRKSVSAGGFNLESTAWKLSQINGRNVTAEGEKYTLELAAEGKMAGVGECNRLTGSYTLGASKALKFENVGMTRMLCPNGEFEDEYGQMLGKVTHYVIDGDMMIMLSNGDSIAVFKRQ